MKSNCGIFHAKMAGGAIAFSQIFRITGGFVRWRVSPEFIFASSGSTDFPFFYTETGDGSCMWQVLRPFA
jgi:hypothetical protein